jgi:hypothetical protein
VLFYHCGSVAEMEQLAMQRLAELTDAARHSRRKEEKRQFNRERHIISQWLTGWEPRDRLGLLVLDQLHAHDVGAHAREGITATGEVVLNADIRPIT